MPKLGGIPRVAVSFEDHAAPQDLRDIRDLGIDVVELRIDRYSSFDRAYVLSEAGKFGKFATIATLRSKKEGGGWDRPEKDRLKLFNAVLPHVSAVDIELSSKKIIRDVIKAARKLKKPVIVSYHNFDKTPQNGVLVRVLKEARSLGADIVKIAVMAKTDDDVRALAGFTIAHSRQNIITIAMGPVGAASRVLFPALGSLLTFACLPGRPTAPGQLDCRQTVGMLRKLFPRYDQAKFG